MTAASLIKGWCPTARRPMQSGDGWLVRVSPPGGTLAGWQAKRLAHLSRHYGNGLIDLTQRANLQIRGVAEAGLEPLQRGLEELDLIPKDKGDPPASILLSPLAGIDPAALLDPRPLANTLEQQLIADPAFYSLPSKFGFAFDDGGSFPMRIGVADIHLRPVLTDDGLRFALICDGSVVDDQAEAAVVPVSDAIDAALRLTRAFLHLRTDERRVRSLLSRVDARVMFRVAGFTHLLRVPVGGSAQSPLGVIPFGTGHVLGVAAPFGAWSADDLHALAAATSPTGTLRLTPWRAMLLPGLSRPESNRILDLCEQRGLIVRVDDPRLRVAACAGAPACSSAEAETRVTAAALSMLLPVGTDVAVHVSGCAKGCAHPAAAPAVLVGRDGRFDLVLNGLASDRPLLVSLTADAALAALGRRAAA